MSLYQQLRSADPALAQNLVVFTAQAFGWEPAGLAQWCALTGADPEEVKQIIHADRIDKDHGRGRHS